MPFSLQPDSQRCLHYFFFSVICGKKSEQNGTSRPVVQQQQLVQGFYWNSIFDESQKPLVVNCSLITVFVKKIHFWAMFQIRKFHFIYFFFNSCHLFVTSARGISPCFAHFLSLGNDKLSLAAALESRMIGQTGRT